LSPLASMSPLATTACVYYGYSSTQVRIGVDAYAMLHPNRIDIGSLVGLSHSSLNIPINYPIIYHPMVLLSSITSSNIADLLTKPLSLSRHRSTTTLIGDLHSPTSTPPTSVASTLVASTTTVDSLAAVVDSATVSDSVLTAPALPIVLDTGTSVARPSDFSLEIAQASYGLIRSPISVVSKALASTPVDPYTLITGEDAIDLLSSDLSALNSDSVETVSSFTKVTFDIRQFGTASLTFIYSKSTSELLHIFVDPTQIDWLHWVPLPRLILPESYFHIFGLDYLQAFALLHLIPIWIYYLLHFAVNLD